MTTKRELLLFICEHPGVDIGSSQVQQHWAEELLDEGWIVKVDATGFEPTAEALDAHPHFSLQDDISDGTTPSAGLLKPPEAGFEKESLMVPASAEDRLTALFLVLLMDELPLRSIFRMATAARQVELHDNAEVQVARDLAKVLLA